MSEVKAGQLVIAKSTDAAVFSDYKGSGLEKVVYSASKVGESLGVATGLSFPGTGVKFNWLEVVYVVQTNFIFGLPQFERKLGYVPDDQVTFKDPEPTKTTATGTGSGTTTPTTGTGTTPTTGSTTTPDVSIPVTTGSGEKITLTQNDKVITKKAVLPTWAYWALGGLALTAAVLVGVLINKNQKKGGKK